MESTWKSFLFQVDSDFEEKLPEIDFSSKSPHLMRRNLQFVEHVISRSMRSCGLLNDRFFRCILNMSLQRNGVVFEDNVHIFCCYRKVLLTYSSSHSRPI